MKVFTAILMLCMAAPAFADNVPALASLPEAEKAYYRTIFDYTLSNIDPGDHFDWTSANAKGTIAVGDLFVSKSGYSCRNFSESYAMGDQMGSDKGIGCKRVGADGWCRLKADSNALSCALEEPYYGLNLPTFSGPSIPGMPDVDMPGGGVGGVGSGYSPSMGGGGQSYHSSKPAAADAASTITSGAGSAAGYVAGHAGGWFSSLFR